MNQAIWRGCRRDGQDSLEQQRKQSIHETVIGWYGRQLRHSAGLKTAAYGDTSQAPEWLKPLLARIHPEVMTRYQGLSQKTENKAR